MKSAELRAEIRAPDMPMDAVDAVDSGGRVRAASATVTDLVDPQS